MLKFLHAADLHLDSSLRGLERYDGAPVEAMQHATRRALVHLVDLALEEKVHFVLLAGDLWDGDWRDYNSGLFFVQQMLRLCESRIPVFLIAGNHDAANRMTRSLRLPEGVRMFSADTPETVELPDLGVAIHGQSFAQQSVTDDLSQRFPPALPGCFNIGMLHTCANGREGHERYAPCSVDGLIAKGYDYWALGHVHKREILCEKPFIAFPGNTQGRSMREAGPKGCLIVRAERGRAQAEFQTLDVFRWEICNSDVSNLEEPDAVIEKAAYDIGTLHEQHNLPMAVRVEVYGATPAHTALLADPVRWTNELRSRLLGQPWSDVWIERVNWRTEPPPGAMSLPENGPIGELARRLAHYRSESAVLLSLCQNLPEFQDLGKKLPAELQGPEGIRLTDPAWLGRLLDQVQPLLTRRLFLRNSLS
jgi:predicted phosphodiesterase